MVVFYLVLKQKFKSLQFEVKAEHLFFIKNFFPKNAS